MSDRDFQMEVLSALGELKSEQAETRAEVKAIVDRLDRLNGSVARHAEKISSLEKAEARREGAESSSTRLIDRFMPGIWTVSGAIAVLILYNANVILKFLH